MKRCVRCIGQLDIGEVVWYYVGVGADIDPHRCGRWMRPRERNCIMPKMKQQKKAPLASKNEILDEFVERARHETYTENLAYFHVARALYASRIVPKETITITDSDIVKPVFFPVIAQEYYEMYETYIGDYDGRAPRFDYDYLFHIELPVLKFFLPYLRRADVFNEHDAPTTFKVSPDNISVMVHPRDEKEDLDRVDLASFFVSKVDTVMGPCAEYGMGMRVAPTPDEALEVFDDPLDKISLSDVKDGVIAPKYDDISKRYYDWFEQGDLPSLN